MSCPRLILSPAVNVANNGATFGFFPFVFFDKYAMVRNGLQSLFFQLWVTIPCLISHCSRKHSQFRACNTYAVKLHNKPNKTKLYSTKNIPNKNLPPFVYLRVCLTTYKIAPKNADSHYKWDLIFIAVQPSRSSTWRTFNFPVVITCGWFFFRGSHLAGNYLCLRQIKYLHCRQPQWL